MRELDPEFAGAGVEVRFFAIGDAAKVAAFAEPYGMGDRCIPDADKHWFSAMGFGQYNLLKLFTDPALKVRRRENKAAGFTQNWGATKLADGAQLPGAAFVDGEGIARWLYRGAHPGDIPPMSEMLKIATGVAT